MQARLESSISGALNAPGTSECRKLTGNRGNAPVSLSVCNYASLHPELAQNQSRHCRMLAVDLSRCSFILKLPTMRCEMKKLIVTTVLFGVLLAVGTSMNIQPIESAKADG
jgi:hypothetical protein